MTKTNNPLEVPANSAELEPAAAAAGEMVESQDPRQRAHASPKLAKGGKGARSLVDNPITIPVIMSLAMPSVLEQLVQAGIGVTDSVVGGHTGSTEEYRAASAAAVTAMTFIQWLGGLLSAALGTGASAIVALSIGANRKRLANRVAGTVCAAALLLGIGVALLFYFGARQFAWLFGLDGLAADLAVQYLHIMSWTMALMIAGNIGTSCLRGAGDTVRPLMITTVMCLMNGVASPALTFGWFGLPAWGVRGNATGTLLSYVVFGIATFGFLLHGDAGLKLTRRHFRIVPHLIGRVMKIGFPSALEGLLLWAGQSFIVILVMKEVDKAVHLSGGTLAAHGAALRIESLAFLPGFGFGIACSTLVGQYLGAKKPEEARRSAVMCTKVALWIMTVLAIPMVFMPRPLLRLLVDSTQVVELGVWPLILAGLAQPAFAVAIVKSMALRGAGDTVSPMWTTISGMGTRVVLIVLAMWICMAYGHADWGLVIVWIGIFLDLGYRGLVMEIVFRRGKWKVKKV